MMKTGRIAKRYKSNKVAFGKSARKGRKAKRRV
jgi:hypothetical protein